MTVLPIVRLAAWIVRGPSQCAYCRRAPRTVIDGDRRYCSPPCREADGEQQALSF